MTIYSAIRPPHFTRVLQAEGIQPENWHGLPRRRAMLTGIRQAEGRTGRPDRAWYACAACVTYDAFGCGCALNFAPVCEFVCSDEEGCTIVCTQGKNLPAHRVLPCNSPPSPVHDPAAVCIQGSATACTPRRRTSLRCSRRRSRRSSGPTSETR